MVGRRTLSALITLAFLALGAAGVKVSQVTQADIRQVADKAWGLIPRAVVDRAVDGDTIELVDGTRVRYIGIDTPEITAQRGAPACYAAEAKARNAELVVGKKVALEEDVSAQDRYGRTLAYVWVADQMINEQLVREGYATVATTPPDVKYAERFVAAEQEARSAGRGLWAPGACR